MTVMVQALFDEANDPARGLAQELSRVIERTENTFFDAGDKLGASVDLVRGLRKVFAGLQNTFSPEHAADLMTRVSQSQGALASMEAAARGILDASVGLYSDLRAIRVEVHELDRVSRTIANVAINARIQAGSLHPPRPAIMAFLERLRDMVSEAEVVEHAIQEGVEDIRKTMQKMDVDMVAIHGCLLNDVTPFLGKVAQRGRTMHEAQEGLRLTSDQLEARFGEISAEVARLVVSLQGGDSFRQRMERVQALVGEMRKPGADPELVQALGRLTHALGIAAIEAAEVEVNAIQSGIQAVQISGREALHVARDFYIHQVSADKQTSAVDVLEAPHQFLSNAAGHGRTAMVQIQAVLESEHQLRDIAHQVRLSGLNAVMICAKLGEQGRVLREVAQWLRQLTDESDGVAAQLQAALARANGSLKSVNETALSGIRQELAGVEAQIEAITLHINGIDTDLQNAMEQCNQSGAALDRALRQAEAQMAAFEQTVAKGRLEFERAQPVGDCDEPILISAETAEKLDGLRKFYTMEAERSIHDRLFMVAGKDQERAVVESPVAAPVAAATGDDLDDIFF